MIIWLQGPSGAGKSTAGRLLAERMSLPFIDLDTMIEREAGISVGEIFARMGEEGFREMERNRLLETAREAGAGGAVVALGGGAVIDMGSRDAIRASGVRVYLDVARYTALARLADGALRPLLVSPESWSDLYGSRLELYRDADISVDAGVSPEEVVDVIERRMAESAGTPWGIRSVMGSTTTFTTSVGSAFLIPTLLRERCRGRRFVVTDSGVYAAHRRSAEAIAGDPAMVHVIESGEENKSFASAERIVEGAARAGLARGDTIVGFGGGVVTDIAGFVGSIYQRGIGVVHIPTTLLAQVDASIGGKTAVNAAGFRNLVGTFRSPDAIFVSTSFLHTLPRRELRSGIVESLKMGIALAPDLAGLVSAATGPILRGVIPPDLDTVIRRSIEVKLGVVASDPFDGGARLALNFGHTFGHALEAVEPGAHTHGEAVAFGMIAAAELAGSLGIVSAERRGAIVDLSLPFAPGPAGPHDTEAILDAMRADKKRTSDGLRFILPAPIAGVEIRNVSDREAILRSMEIAFDHIARYDTVTAT